MRIVRSPRALNAALAAARSSRRKIGFVPTMGFLHEGHLSLVRRSNAENDLTVASIFVNPLQFGPREDFKRYPRNWKRDVAMLKREKVDFLFAPTSADMVPDGFQTEVKVGKVSLPLCGVSRPTHFAGVATVVLKLLNQVRPDAIYLGRKDYQQVLVVERMVRDLGVPVRVRPCPIVREPDDLAMSSRNVLLSPAHRAQAPAVRRALLEAARLVRSGEKRGERVRRALAAALRRAPDARVDYAEIVDAATLGRVVELRHGKPVLLAVAVTFGKTRLIDNELVRV